MEEICYNVKLPSNSTPLNSSPTNSTLEALFPSQNLDVNDFLWLT